MSQVAAIGMIERGRVEEVEGEIDSTEPLGWVLRDQSTLKLLWLRTQGTANDSRTPHETILIVQHRSTFTLKTAYSTLDQDETMTQAILETILTRAQEETTRL